MSRFLPSSRIVRIFPWLLLLCALGACDGGGDGGGSGNAPPAPTYGVSGTVSHLDTGSLTISDGSETLTIAQGATTFAFTHGIAGGSPYSITVTAQPAGGNCVVSNGSGTIGASAVINVGIVCNTAISQPIALGVNAVGSTNSLSSRIFLPVSVVGTNPVTINAILDSGSAGTVLNAFDVFHDTTGIVTSNGFVFPSGQSSITYNGITVTNVGATRTYGEQSSNPTQEVGNLGFAQVTFGSGPRVTTAVVPIFLVYQFISNGNPVAPTNFANLIGINPALAPIAVPGTTASTPLSSCTLQSTATCGVTSPFRYLTYASGIDDGYTLARVSFTSCNITVAGSCPTTPALTLGVTSTTAAGFSTTMLSGCGTGSFFGSVNEMICSQVIPNVKVMSGNASFTGAIIFDSGAPTTRLSVPSGSTFPDSLADGSVVAIATASGFGYQYTTGSGYLTTTVSKPPATETGAYTNSGIGFFAQNSLLVNYSKGIEGWRNGS